MTEKKTLIDYFPEWDVGNGIFSVISNIKKDDINWDWLINNAIELDQEYFGLHAGNKPVSPIVQRYINNEVISQENANKLARIIINRFGENWLKLAKIYGFEYNPIHNYNMQEVETPDITRMKTGNNTSTETPDITRTKTPNLTETETPNTTKIRTPNLTDTETPNIINEEQLGEKIINSENQNDSTYGFNSTTAVPKDMTVGQSSEEHSGANINKETGTRTTVTTGTETETETGNTTKEFTGSETETEKGTRTTADSLHETETEQGTRTLVKSGNIGVTTTQNMIQQEIDIWKWNFIDTVFKNVDKILTLSIYI